jgi:hypothetical protein
VSPRVQVFVYPEELRFTSPRALAALLAEIGCDAVSMALVYHRARRVFPRHRHVSTLPCTTAYFTPDRSRYGDLVPDAVADPELQDRVLAFREECSRAGIRFGAWVVGLHHEGLALRHPEAASRALDGSVLGHSLCPSAMEAVDYLAALAGDVAARVAPDAVDLEAWLYPAWEPSYTLTLALEPLAPEAELLATQCFCPHCRELFGDDADELCRRARAAAGRLFRNGEADDDADIVGELEVVRAAGAARVASAVAETVHAERVELRLFASGPPAQARLQGLAKESVEHADALLLGCARLAGDELTARFEGLLEASGRGAATVSTNWTPQRSPESMAADVIRLAAAGADGLALYNLSLVPAEGLDAFRAAAAAFRAAVAA